MWRASDGSAAADAPEFPVLIHVLTVTVPTVVVRLSTGSKLFGENSHDQGSPIAGDWSAGGDRK